jgi:phosphonate transport system substrate-binding protein
MEVGMKKGIVQSARMVFVGGLLAIVPGLALGATLTLGSVDGSPWNEIKKFLPLSAFLEKELKPDGIDHVKVIVSKSIPEMAAALREGKIDVYLDSPYPTIAVGRLSGAKLLLRRWKKGVSEYHSVIFAHKDARVERLEDLKGKSIALEDPWSSTGYFFPKIAMMERGLKLAQKNGPADPVGSGEIGYVFSSQEENMMMWVLRGKVAAGAMDNANYVKEAREEIDKLKILHRSVPIPRHIVSYRADLPAKLVSRLKEVLTNMEHTAEGKKALDDFEKTTKFDEIPAGGLAVLFKARGFIDSELAVK